MRLFGSLMMFVGVALATASAALAWHGQNVKVNGVAIDGFNGPALVALAVGVFLTVAGAMMRRRALVAKQEGIEA